MDEGELTALLTQHAARHAVPGAALGILRDGATMTAYCGVANVATGAPVTPETAFSVGSLTKSMVATVIARLADAGRLSFDDPVAAHVRELRRSGWAQRATVRGLLANSSGLPLRAVLEFDFAGRGSDDKRALSRFAADVAHSRPTATFWSYSNAGWCLLGRVIETVTNAPWEDAMMHHLGSVGMRGTTFGVDAVAPRRAAGHDLTADGPVPIEPLRTRAYGPAGANAVSTVTDLLRFAAWHLVDPSLAELRTVHSEVSIHGWLDSWCLGWARFDWDNSPVWGWDGLISGERSSLRILPDHRAAVVLMTNGSTGRAMCRSLFTDLADLLFGIRVPPLKLDASPGAVADLSRFSGVYAWPDWRVEVTAGDDSLLITDEDSRTVALPIDERTFLVDPTDPDNPTVTFDAHDAEGRPRVLYQMLWGLPRVETRGADR